MPNDADAGGTSTIAFTGLPTATDTLYILWGDGSKEKVENVTVTSSTDVISIDHAFSDNEQYHVGASATTADSYKYKLSVYAFEGTSRLMAQGVDIVLDGSN